MNPLSFTWNHNVTLRNSKQVDKGKALSNIEAKLVLVDVDIKYQWVPKVLILKLSKYNSSSYSTRD